MERRDAIWIPGVILLGLGVLGILGNFGVFGGIGVWVWAALFALAGVGFLSWYGRDRAQWWALIPGATLLGLALTILLGNNEWGGTVFLTAMGLGFLAVFSNNREHWWAIIPAGVLLSLALVTRTGEAGGTWLFIGLAATFAVVWLESQRWAVYPAVACLVLAALTANWLTGAWSIVWSLALIAAGAYLLRPRGGGGSLKH
jgi:hypothetical protein